MDVSLVIPTIDEASNLRVIVPQLKTTFGPKILLEILIIDGASKDGTAETALRMGCTVRKQEGPGYASAVLEGLRAARGRFVIVMDADGSHTPNDAKRLYDARSLADVVICSRYVKGGGAETAWYRALLSRLLNFIYRTIVGLPYREISGGFRVYRREVVDAILADPSFRSQFYEVQEDLIARSHWLGFSAVEIPYIYRPRIEGVSKAKLFLYGYHLLRNAFRLRKLKNQIVSAEKCSIRKTG